MVELVLIISSLFSTQIYAEPNHAERNYLIEGSTMGIRLGYDLGNWRILARVNGDYSAEETSSLKKENDSITYSYESGIGYNSNIEFGLGLDRVWKYEKAEFGIRTELAYIYPFTNTNEYLRYSNINITTCRIAIIADHSLGPIFIGGSFGPAVTWNYQHYIYEADNSKGDIISSNRRNTKIDANIKSELFVRYEF